MIMRIFLILLLLANGAFAAADSRDPRQLQWSFDGFFGTVDRQSAQRGFQVYKEVCASCHSLDQHYYRNLADIGFSEAEVKAIAAEVTVMDGPNDDGEMFERPGRPSDKFVPAFANEKAARAANNGAYPPHLSLMIKARPDGANYLYSLLTGYREAPINFKVNEGMYYNPYFPGKQIAMPLPLSDDLVEYLDGTNASVSQMSKDLVNFLQWAAEPEMEHRKHMGIKVMIYLVIFTLLFYIVKKRMWKNIK